MEVVRRRIREREIVINEAKKWAQKLAYKSSVILVGSYARGDFNKWSDIDIVIISDEISGNPLERLRKIDIPVGYEVVIWTLDEFRKMLRKKNPLAIETVENGIFLRDDYNILKEYSHWKQNS